MTDGMERFDELMKQSESPLAIMSEGFGKYHVVDTTTFDNSAPAPADYDGYSANIGGAEALCGHELFSRMVPESEATEGLVCGNCLRSLRAGSEQSGEDE